MRLGQGGEGPKSLMTYGRRLTEQETLAFARRAFRSVWMLELLLLLCRDANRSWRTSELVTALRANTRIVSESLAELINLDCVTQEDADRYRFRPASPTLAESVMALAELYTRKPVSVVREIITAPNDKIQIFADAFRFKH